MAQIRWCNQIQKLAVVANRLYKYEIPTVNRNSACNILARKQHLVQFGDTSFVRTRNYTTNDGMKFGKITKVLTPDLLNDLSNRSHGCQFVKKKFTLEIRRHIKFLLKVGGCAIIIYVLSICYVLGRAVKNLEGKIIEDEFTVYANPTQFFKRLKWNLSIISRAISSTKKQNENKPTTLPQDWTTYALLFPDEPCSEIALLLENCSNNFINFEEGVSVLHLVDMLNSRVHLRDSFLRTLAIFIEDSNVENLKPLNEGLQRIIDLYFAKMHLLAGNAFHNDNLNGFISNKELVEIIFSMTVLANLEIEKLCETV